MHTHRSRVDNAAHTHIAGVQINPNPLLVFLVHLQSFSRLCLLYSLTHETPHRGGQHAALTGAPTAWQHPATNIHKRHAYAAWQSIAQQFFSADTRIRQQTSCCVMRSRKHALACDPANQPQATHPPIHPATNQPASQPIGRQPLSVIYLWCAQPLVQG